jgi:hypothetical protein
MEVFEGMPVRPDESSVRQSTLSEGCLGRTSEPLHLARPVFTTLTF